MDSRTMWKSVIGAIALMVLFANNSQGAVVSPTDTRGIFDLDKDGISLGFETFFIGVNNRAINVPVESRTVSKYDLSAFGAISNATLTIDFTDFGQFSDLISVHTFNSLNPNVDLDDFFNNTNLSGQFNPVGNDLNQGQAVLDITASVQAALSNGDLVGFLFEIEERENFTNIVGFDSIELDISGTERAAIVPLPAAFPLLATALAGFGLLRLRRSKRA